MIAKYNYLDFLFSQEFVTSSVGSHLNHPVKKYAKGKVVFSENSVFTQGEANGSNSIIDFDEIVKSENVGDDFKKK
jgi:predicted nucleic-acid-binding protein